MVLKTKRKRWSVLVFLIALWLPLWGSYAVCDGLAEADLFSPGLIFENPDQDGFNFGSQNKWKTVPAATYPFSFPGESGLPEPAALFLIPPDFPSRLSSVLRC